MKVGNKTFNIMKKMFFASVATLLVGSLSFANSEPTKKEVVENKNQTTEKKGVVAKNDTEKETVCVITCSTTVNGVTYETSAGNWFTSCNSAGNQCLRKLGELSANLAP